MAEKTTPNFVDRILARFGRDRVQEVAQNGFAYGDTLTQAALLGNGVISSRSRQDIYAKYQQMMSDPVVSAALRMHVTGALGGDDQTGDMVFIEAKPEAKKQAAQAKMVEEINGALSPLINRMAMQLAYNAVAFGDSYARMYPEQRRGVVELSCDEMLLPPLVQPYEVGNKTVVCTVAVGSRWLERLVMDEIVRMKMPRLIYTPQPLAVEKAWRARIKESKVENLPAMPALVGGSFLADAETQFNNFQAALAGLTGQRILDSIDESYWTVQVQGMTKEQQADFIGNIKRILKKSKDLADDSMKSGRPFLGRIKHILPVWTDKQLMQVQGVNAAGGSGGGRAGNITIEDVLFQAKLLTGALGMDITMLGFADMLSGGLGDGGFFRTSVQTAERGRAIRTALVEAVNHIIDVHVLYRYRLRFSPEERPWKVNLYGTIAAMETERQKTALDAANYGSVLVNIFNQLKESGLDEPAMSQFLEKQLRLDPEEAKAYAKSIDAAAKKALEGENGGGFVGGFAAGSGQPPEEDVLPPSKRKPSLE